MNTEPETRTRAGASPARSKKILRNSLLAFAVGSLVYMAVREIIDHRSVNHADGNAIAGDIGPATKLIVYYFAEGKECSTCENLPVFTKQALDTGFGGELSSGVIAWRVVDVDERRNEHFVTDYNLYTKSVVLVRIDHGKQIRWKNLESIWDYVYDKPAFMKYIQEQTREFLDTAS